MSSNRRVVRRAPDQAGHVGRTGHIGRMGRIGRLWTSAPLAVLCSLAAWLVAGCGGELAGPAVTNVTASNVRFGQTMTIVVSGANLDQPGLVLDVQGKCTNLTRLAASTEAQAAYTCLLSDIGGISPTVIDAQGNDLARVRLDVPVPQVTFTVSQDGRTGRFVVEPDVVAAPVTALNFMRYVNAGFYNNTIFHRVLPDRIVQGGQYNTSKQAKTVLFEPIVLESGNGLRNLRGTIAMARTSEPNSASSQFYVNLVDNPEFDRVNDAQPGYAVFGRVVSGQDVLDEIGKVPVQVLGFEFPSIPVVNVVVTSAAQTR